MNAETIAMAPLLIELGTEELPPKALRKLSEAFTQGIVDGLKKAGFEVSDAESFAAPRRLAVLIPSIAASQPDRDVERKGPALKAAYDAEGNPTKAVMGFARSCGVEVDELQQQETDKGTWLVFKATEKGQALADLIEDIINQSLSRLPIPKRMRWGDNDAEFVRPVHWLLLMHGDDVIDAEVMGLKSSSKTYGHRFHAPNEIVLQNANDYKQKLSGGGYVLASFEDRKQNIKQQVIDTAKQLGGEAVLDEGLLEEVCSLNEWPVAVAGEFEEIYLDVPAQALIKTMQDNQKYFPVIDTDGNLKNFFITISNIDSKSPEKVKQGNERVVRPRLADAKFFWEQDQKQPLESFNEALEKVVFQKTLGTIAEKTRRVAALSEKIAVQLDANLDYIRRAAVLSKCDLMTDMVGEFASLQGVMGKCYAQKAGEAEEVALALDEQYKPRGASDDTATTTTGQILSISDKMDTLVGIFAIGEKPTGEKDPYALRRASLGILRTIIERQLDLDLKQLISSSAALLSAKLSEAKIDSGNIEQEVFNYIIERLRAYYLDRGVSADVFDAVSALSPSRPLDFDKRIKAVTVFRELSEAQSLAAANKRVGNILKKSALDTTALTIDTGLFSEDAEKKLYESLSRLSPAVEALFDSGDYEAALSQLSSLRDPVDAFFDSVMVMADDETVKNNRIALLSSMNQLFLRAADLSRLHQ